MSDSLRRKILKIIAAISDAIIKGISLPESWRLSIVKKAVVHAQQNISSASIKPYALLSYSLFDNNARSI